MDRKRLYHYLQLQSFTKDEVEHVFRTISSYPQPQPQPQEEEKKRTSTVITEPQIAAFLFDRMRQIEDELLLAGRPPDQQQQQQQHQQQDSNATNSSASVEERRHYAQDEAHRFLRVFMDNTRTTTATTKKDKTATVSQDHFVKTILRIATAVDMKRMWPITLSILLVGTSVGIVTPAMPFVVEQIGLTPGQYGTVVSAFALAKMAGNIPSAILVERHGRKPYLTFSLAVIALGVGGIGAASTFEQLYACRLFTGAGVAALTTASQLMVTDVSTPLNRATTMSPIVSAFAAGTALGPAFGGALVDQVGLQATFFMVGTSYLGVALLNRAILQETKPTPFYLPWMHNHSCSTTKQQKQQENHSETTDSQQPHNSNSNKNKNNLQTTTKETISLASASKAALAQWVPLFQNSKIRSIMIMNGFYWFALAGSQMTLLPLILTSPSSGLNMTASGVGQVYMVMSLVQVMSNPLMARFLVDRIGKAPAIAGGCTVIATSMTCLPLCTDNWPLFVTTLGFWALGSSMLSTAPLAYISDQVEDEKRAQAIAMLRTSGDIGFLFGASCIGGLADFCGSLDLAMQSSGGFLSAATLWFIVRQSLLHSASFVATSTATSTSASTSSTVKEDSHERKNQ